MCGFVGTEGARRALLGSAAAFVAILIVGPVSAQPQSPEPQSSSQQPAQSQRPAATPPGQTQQSNVRLETIRVRSPRRAPARTRQTGPVQTAQPASPPRESAYGPVQGYIANQSATGIKTDTPLHEIPQSITVVTADRMHDQGVTTIQQSFRYVPGVFADAYGPDLRVDSIRVRGSDPDIYLDGMRIDEFVGSTSHRVDPYSLVRTEVLRGPTSVLYGNTTTAGIINLVSKRPLEEELSRDRRSIRQLQPQAGPDRPHRQDHPRRAVALPSRRHRARQRLPDRLRQGRPRTGDARRSPGGPPETRPGRSSGSIRRT